MCLIYGSYEDSEAMRDLYRPGRTVFKGEFLD